MRRGILSAVIVTAAMLCPPQAARADLTESLLIGLNLLDYNSQFTKNYLGKGWDFDSTAYYSGQTYRFGLADLTLGSGGATPVSISAGYTLRGLPSARFSMQTTNPLAYTLNANYGMQDLVATGSILIDVDTNINALGFYDMAFHISNRGVFQTEGLGPTDQGTLDFDAGPIVVSGNIYADILAALAQPFFTAAGTENPFAKFSQKATRGLTDAVDLNGLAAGTLSEDQVGQAINNMIVAALLGQDPGPNLLNELILPNDLLPMDGLSEDTMRWAQPVPEPTTIGLLALALFMFHPQFQARS
ncbi:MAG TPA: hypothetical protein VLM89_05145 [Phycisphaerae bacterium]|nr:hypothetical protein [Phycisphaerae bacterium]